MRIRVGTVLAGTGVVAGVALLGALLTVVVPWAFPDDPEPVPTEARADGKAFDPLALFRSPERGKARRPGAGAKAKAKAPREPVLPPDKEPVLEAEARALARTDFREERADSLNARLDEYAMDAGWDEATTEEVSAILGATAGRISRQLADVDRGEVAWEDVRADLRDYREAQAKKVRRRLGDDGFDDFVSGMGLERFLGERPARGRLRP